MGERSVLLIVAAFACIIQSSLVEQRVKRQTVVSSNALTNGKADMVETDAMAHHFKTNDGVVGMNVSSGGNATGQGQASIDNSVDGTVGNKNINASGNVGATGTNAQSSSDIFSQIYGDDIKITNYQQGKAQGVGDSSAMANGGAVISKDGEKSPFSSDKLIATSGATGSLGSSSEVVASQQLTWDSIVAQLVGSAVADGLGNAQANMDLGAGNQVNGIEVNGLVSGWNDAEGKVNAQVNGNAQLDNDKHDLVGNMYGSVNGSSNSHLVGASNLQSNVSGVNNTISAFGDSNIQTDGESAIDLMSETNLANKQGAVGNILMNGTANGANKSMTVQNGFKVNDVNGGTLAIGAGGIVGEGSEKSDGSIQVDTTYKDDGDTKIVSNADGNSMSTGGKNTSLNINNQADMTNSNGVNNMGLANSGGTVSGENSNMTGNGFLNVGSSGANGNSYMEGFGGGKGPSAAETFADLSLKEGDDVRNSSVRGSVSASGDQTSVHSISVVTDYQGMQSLSNYQKATSTAKGSSSSSASNSVILRKKRSIRRKRASLGVLFDHLF